MKLWFAALCSMTTKRWNKYIADWGNWEKNSASRTFRSGRKVLKVQWVNSLNTHYVEWHVTNTNEPSPIPFWFLLTWLVSFLLSLIRRSICFSAVQTVFIRTTALFTIEIIDPRCWTAVWWWKPTVATAMQRRHSLPRSWRKLLAAAMCPCR